MTMPKVKLAVQPVPKTLVRIGAAGEFVKNLSLGTLSDHAIRQIQQGVAEGLIGSIIVTGKDGSDIPRVRFHLTFDPLTDDNLIMLDLEGGKSTIEALDVGLAGGVAAAVALLQRRNLRPEVTFKYTPEARANPIRLAEAKKRLDYDDVEPLRDVQTDPDYNFPAPTWPSPPTTTYAPPAISSGRELWTETYRGPKTAEPPVGYSFERFLDIRPAKDPGIRFLAEGLRKKQDGR